MEGEKREEALFSLMQKLIEIPSVTGSCAVADAMEYIESWFEAEGIRTERIISRGVVNLIAGVGQEENAPTILWNAHVDVVPPGDAVRWDYPPFHATKVGEYVYGRGTSDAKSGLAAMMYALKELKKTEDTLPGKIQLMISGAEENGSEHGTVAILEHTQERYAAAIVAEPSDMCIEIAQRGLRWLELKVHGIASHGARPHLGINAISQCGKIMRALEELDFEDKNPLFEQEIKGTTISVNKIHGGIQNNIIPEDCRMVLDCRMMPGQTPQRLYRVIRETAEEVVDKRCQMEYNALGAGWDAFILNESEPIVQVVQKAYKKVHGKEAVLRGKSGCTDASHIYSRNIPVVVFGPGDPNESHSGNEKVNFRNVLEMVDILCDSAKNFFVL